MWRVFAINDESGAVMCDYPEGSEKPVIPIPYCEECMTGFEYSFAGLLISEGFIEDGLKVIRAIRDRYDGKKRNPWNEIECGNNYARPMASFSLLPIFSGMTYDLPKKHIGFAPILPGKFKCFWSLGTGWGDFSRTDKQWKIDLSEGSLELETVSLDENTMVKSVKIDGKDTAFTQNGSLVSFARTTVKKHIRIERN